jgi:hypothetical protein
MKKEYQSTWEDLLNTPAMELFISQENCEIYKKTKYDFSFFSLRKLKRFFRRQNIEFYDYHREQDEEYKKAFIKLNDKIQHNNNDENGLPSLFAVKQATFDGDHHLPEDYILWIQGKGPQPKYKL